MKRFIPNKNRPVTSLVLLAVFLCSLFVFQVSPTKADHPLETVWVRTQTLHTPYNGQLKFYDGGGTLDQPDFEYSKGEYTENAVTIESDEWELVSLPIPDHTRWLCKDIDGEVSMLEAGNREGFMVKKAELVLFIDHNRPYVGKEIDIAFYLDMERDEGVIGVDNKIVDWNHAKWTTRGKVDGLELKDNWAFGGIMVVEVVQENTYPPSSGESEKQKAFFGLISQEDYRKAYLCDNGAIGLPDGFANNINEENFQDFCQGWYYECAAKELSEMTEEEIAQFQEDESEIDENEDATIVDNLMKSTDDDLPLWVIDGQAYIDKQGQGIYVPEWLEWMKPKPVEGQEKVRAILKPNFGNMIYIYNRALGRWQGPINTYQHIYRGDIVMMGEDSSAVIYVKGDETIYTMDVSDNASVQLTLPDEKTDYPNLWQLYYGAVKAKRKFFGKSPLQVHPPQKIATFQGIVGARSEFVFLHDPETETSTVYLIDGEIDYYNLVVAGPEDGRMTTGQKLVITGDGTEAIQPFSETELESVLISRNLAEMELLDQEEIDRLFSEELDAENPDESGDNNLKLAIFGIFMCVLTAFGIGVVIAIFVLLSKRQAA